MARHFTTNMSGFFSPTQTDFKLGKVVKLSSCKENSSRAAIRAPAVRVCFVIVFQRIIAHFLRKKGRLQSRQGAELS